jgi:hypothetical protein
MSAISPLNFLISFLGFFIYLVLVLTFGFKSDNISIYDRKRFNRNRNFQQLVLFAPFLFGFIYLLLTQRAGLDEFLMLVFLPMLFLLSGEYVFFQPKLDTFIHSANRLFNTLKYDGHEVRYSFDSRTDKLLLNRDKPEYTSLGFVDLRLDRVYKNGFGEYFWIQASAKGASEPTIKHLDSHAARNLLRADSGVYLQEFNEEPYYKSK